MISELRFRTLPVVLKCLNSDPAVYAIVGIGLILRITPLAMVGDGFLEPAVSSLSSSLLYIFT